jgi:two-component system, NtrC family, sensor histidine kinase AtoS
MTYSTLPAPRIPLRRSRSPGAAEFEALFNMMPGACLLFDRQQDAVLMVNSQLLQLTAFTARELVGAHLQKLLPDLKIEQLTPGEETASQLNRRLREPVRVSVNTTPLDKDNQQLVISLELAPEGVYEWLRQRNSPEYETLFRILLELTRIAELGDINESLLHALEVIRQILGTAYICVYQAESHFPKLDKIVTIEPEPVFPDSVPSTDLIRLANTSIWMPGKRVLTEIHRSGRVANMKYVASTPLGQDGALFGLLVIGDPEYLPENTPEELLSFLGNLVSSALQRFILVGNLQTENRYTQELLSIRNCLMENIDQGILVVQPNMVITEMNPSAELMLGYADWEARGQLLENILIGADGLVRAFETAVQGIPTHNMGTVSLHRRTGQAFPAHIHVIPAMKGEQLLGVMIFITDVSADEQNRVITQQLENRAFLGEFTSIFAHEVRNPINNISAGLQLFATRDLEDSKFQDAVGRMQSDCTRLEHLMESILSFSKTTESVMKPVDIAELLQRILYRWHPRLSRLNIKSHFHVAEDTPKVWGDTRSLDQVFTNLIANAVEAMSSNGGTLALRIATSDLITNPPQVEISVSDNGMGIPDDVRERLFEPFVTNKTRGTGLGLAITKQIVTAHKGTIQVNSFPGGTIFHVYLPAVSGETRHGD